MNDLKNSPGILEKKLEYTFRNTSLLTEALTHSSFTHEQKIKKMPCNERLEYLGDAVLELVSSEYIFSNYPELPEGKMSTLRASLVCETALAQSAECLGLGDLLFLGKGEELGGGRNKPSVTSDAFEALIGALYLDGGMDTAKALIYKYVLNDVPSHLAMQDPKTALQEKVQAEGNTHHIEYRLISETGPEHDKEFLVELYIDNEKISEGKGRNRKTAEKMAAAAALESR